MYTVYRTYWESFVGEEFVVLYEADNNDDRYVMLCSLLHSQVSRSNSCEIRSGKI